MIIIGELINASRKQIRAAIESRDVETIQTAARDQADNGADYIDVNAGTFVGQEAACLRWLVETVQDATDRPCALDSPDPVAIEAALAVHQGVPLINSISLERARYDALLPLITGTGFKVIALCMSDDGMPQTTDDRLRIAERLIHGLTQNNVALDNIYIDPLVQPISVNKAFGMEFLDAIEQIMTRFPGVHTACGLSNVSYGLPERRILNQIFMAMAICKGLDGAIVNPLDARMMATIVAAQTLAGRDDYCINYLQNYRADLFKNL